MLSFYELAVSRQHLPGRACVLLAGGTKYQWGVAQSEGSDCLYIKGIAILIGGLITRFPNFPEVS